MLAIAGVLLQVGLKLGGIAPAAGWRTARAGVKIRIHVGEPAYSIVRTAAPFLLTASDSQTNRTHTRDILHDLRLLLPSHESVRSGGQPILRQHGWEGRSSPFSLVDTRCTRSYWPMRATATIMSR